MRPHFWKPHVILILCILFFLHSFLVPRVEAWDQEDYEIFDLVDALESAEGKDVNFYSWLGLDPSASLKDINAAYRKMSLELHPDKNKDKGPIAQEKFARLGSIAAILRNKDSRERYNFFLKNGVPRWRGTGYFYRRHRPGIIGVMTFLVILFSVMHYVIMWINFYQERKRIRYYIQEAREIAWGKRMKKQMTRKRANINDLQFYVEGDNVTLVTEEGEKFPLDETNIVAPKLSDLIIFAVPRLAYRKLTKRFGSAGNRKANGNLNGREEVAPSSDKSSLSSDDELSTQSETGTENAKARINKRAITGRRSNRNRK